LGVPAQRIDDPDALRPAVQAGIAGGGPTLLDVRVADGFGG
jgi:thiamine pyrophosphate-dependent acetolactate synthase large subunit-like protein